MMRKPFLKLFLIFSFSLTQGFSATNTNPIWENYHQGQGDNSDRLNKVVSDGAGNFVAVGYSVRSGNYKDVLTIKFDQNGDTLWVRTKNGKESADDEGISAAVDASGNVYVAAVADWGISSNDILLIKYDQGGTKLWDTTWNSPAYFDDAPIAMELDPNGNILIGGSVEPDTVSGSSDYITLKFDPNGILLWSQQYSRLGVANGKDEMAGMVVDGAGDVYVTGRSSNGNDDDFVTLKYNGSTGAQMWLQIYNSGNGDDRAAAITKDNAGNIIVTGRNDNGSNDDFRTIKYSSAGVLQWSKAYNAPANQNDRALAVTVDPSDNVYVTGQSDADNTATTNYDFGTVKYNSSGVQQWARITGSPFNQYDIPAAIVSDASGNVFITGKSDQDLTISTDNDWMTVMYNTGGTLQWTLSHAGTRTGNGDNPYSMILSGSNLYVVGDADNLITEKDATIIKYDVIGTEIWVKDINGEGDFNESAKAVVVDANDFSYSCGYSFRESNNRDATIVKVNTTGVYDCSYTFQGIKGDDDEFTDLALSTNGFIYAVGYTKVTNEKSNILVVKVDPATCTEVWNYTYDYIGQSDKGESIALDAAGNVYITGRSDQNIADSADNNDIVTIKLDANGNEIWLQRFNGTGNLRDEPAKILLDGTGSIIVCGRTENVHDDDFVVLKYDAATGNPVWSSPAIYGGPFANDDRALDMTIDAANNIFVCGYSQTGSGSANEDPVLIKFDSNGILAGFYGYSGLGTDEAISIGHDASDNIYAVFRMDADPTPLQSNYDFLTMKFDNSLNPVWVTPPQYDSPIQQDDVPVKLLVTTVGVVVTGTTENDTVAGRVNQNWLTMLYDFNGSLVFSANFDGPNGTDDAPNNLAVHGSALWVCGYAEGTGSNQKDNAILKYDLLVGVKEVSQQIGSTIFPNPFHTSSKIELEQTTGNNHLLRVTDLSGAIVKEITFNGNSVDIESNGLAAGMYQYQVYSEGSIISRGKFVIN